MDASIYLYIAQWATILSPIIAVVIAVITTYVNGRDNRRAIERISAEARRQAAETNRLTRTSLSLAIEQFRLELYKSNSRLCEVNRKIYEVEQERSSVYPSSYNFDNREARLSPLKKEQKYLQEHQQQLKRVIASCEHAINQITIEWKQSGIIG